MKKIFTIIIILSTLLFCSCGSNSKINEFNSDEYIRQYKLDSFLISFDINPIYNTDDAKKGAKEIWKHFFEDISFWDFFNTDLFMKYEYSFDSDEKIWLVRRVWIFAQSGGAMGALINENGEAIAAWREK